MDVFWSVLAGGAAGVAVAVLVVRVVNVVLTRKLNQSAVPVRKPRQDGASTEPAMVRSPSGLSTRAA